MNKTLIIFAAKMLRKEILGKTVLAWLNIVFVQWFFIRIARNEDWTNFSLLKGIVPVTGWWNNYIYVKKRRKK